MALSASGPGLYRATYTARRAGDHQLRVLWAGRLVKGTCNLTSLLMTSAICRDGEVILERLIATKLDLCWVGQVPTLLDRVLKAGFCQKYS